MSPGMAKKSPAGRILFSPAGQSCLFGIVGVQPPAEIIPGLHISAPFLSVGVEEYKLAAAEIHVVRIRRTGDIGQEVSVDIMLIIFPPAPKKSIM